MESAWIEELRREILAWYDARARELPWRGSRDPYRIWVSEIMLQQTRAETVIPYYQRFMRDYPDVCALADAELADVLKHWEGLGYYSRARNLHRAANLVVDSMGGAFPSDAEGLRRLPGVGEYTSGMIASIAYGERAPAIDGNQVRVLSRLFEMDEPARSPSGARRLRAYAQRLLSPERPGDFNQALMDIGAGICKPAKPDCARCPARAHCLANSGGHPERLPVLPEKIEKRTERRGVAIVLRGGRVLVNRRPEHGLLGGLYEFPNFLDAVSGEALAECLLEKGLEAAPIGKLMSVRHVFTHLVWVMQGFSLSYKDGQEPEGMCWVGAEALDALAMSSAMRAYREAALGLLAERTHR